MQPTLLLVYEPEAACRARLLADGFAAQATNEIASYLAQSTDIAPEFEAIGIGCTAQGIDFLPVELDTLTSALPRFDPAETLVWTLTDGVAYFRGAAAPTLARLRSFRTIGADDALFALCQDKFRAGAVLRALGLPCPQAGLARDGEWLVQPPESTAGWFVKPNRLGAKVGIWDDSHCRDPGHALDLSRRVFAAYRDDVIVQSYVAGRNVRASFLAVHPSADVEALGIFFVDADSDFQTMRDSMALYGETGAAAKAAGAYAEPALIPVAALKPEADAAIRRLASAMMVRLELRDVFSIDLRVETNGTIHLIEFEVCPGLPCFDFRVYCRDQWGLGLADAIAITAANRIA